MKVTLIVLTVVGSLLAAPAHGAAGKGRRQTRAERGGQRVVNLTKRPDLGAEAGLVTRFKIASRKTEYRPGEMMGLDIALLNAGDAPLFLRRLADTVTLEVQGQGGEKVGPRYYMSVSSIITANSFTLGPPRDGDGVARPARRV